MNNETFHILNSHLDELFLKMGSEVLSFFHRCAGVRYVLCLDIKI